MSLSSKLPQMLYRVDPGPPLPQWPRWRGLEVAHNYRSKGHAVNRLHHLRSLGYPSPTIHEAVLSFVDITDQHPDPKAAS